MSIKANGGSAFPCDVFDGKKHTTSAGMDLRDYFAAKAMQAIVSSIDGEGNYQRLKRVANNEGLTVSQWISSDAYKQADAMLKARTQ